MIKKILIVISLYSIIWSYEIPQKFYNDASIINDLLINCRFDAANKYCDSLILTDSSEPLFYYLKITSFGLRIVDYDRMVGKSEFLSTYNKGIEVLDSLEKNEGKSSDVIMLKGFLKASKSSLFLVDKSYGAAVKIGKESLKLISESKSLNSSNYDVDYYVGFYNYAQSELKKRLFFLLFWMDGSSKEGVKALERCSSKSRFMGRAADMVLVDILVREKHYGKANLMLTQMLSVYPRSRFLFWTKMRYYKMQGEWSGAGDVYISLSRSYFTDSIWHNGLVTSLEAINMLKKSKKNRKNFALEVKNIVPSSKLTKDDMALYNKILNEIN